MQILLSMQIILPKIISFFYYAFYLGLDFYSALEYSFDCNINSSKL